MSVYVFMWEIRIIYIYEFLQISKVSITESFLPNRFN